MTRSLLKDNALFFEWAMRLLDPLLVAAVGAAAYGVYLDDPMLAERYTLAIIGMTFACAALFPFVGLYSSQRGVTLFEEVRRLVNAWLLLATAWFAFLFLSKTGTDFSRVWSIYWIIAGFLVHLAVRGAIRVTLRMLRRRGYNVRRIAIVGAGEFGREIAQRIGKMPWSGLHVRGFYDDEPPLHRAAAASAPFLGAVDQLLRDLAGGAIDQVWIALPLRAEARIREVLEDLRHYSVQVRFVPDIFDFTLLHHSMTRNRRTAGHQPDRIAAGGREPVARSSSRTLLVSLSILRDRVAPDVADRRSASNYRLPARSSIGRSASRGTASSSGCSNSARCRSTPRRRRGPVWVDAAPKPARRASARSCAARASTSCPSSSTCCAARCRWSARGPSGRSSSSNSRSEIPGYMQKHLVKAGITGWAQVNDFRGDTDLHEADPVRPLLHRELVAVVRPAHHRAYHRARLSQPQRPLVSACQNSKSLANRICRTTTPDRQPAIRERRRRQHRLGGTRCSVR